MHVITAIATAPLRLVRGSNYQRERGDLKVRIIPECFVFQAPAVSQALWEPPPPKNKCLLVEHDYMSPPYKQRRLRHLPCSCDFQSSIGVKWTLPSMSKRNFLCSSDKCVFQGIDEFSASRVSLCQIQVGQIKTLQFYMHFCNLKEMIMYEIYLDFPVWGFAHFFIHWKVETNFVILRSTQLLLVNCRKGKYRGGENLYP